MAQSDAFYIELRDETVVPLLTEFGKDFEVRAQGTYDPTTGSNAPTTTRTVKGVVADQQDVIAITSEGNASWVGKKNVLLDPFAAFLPNEEVQVNGKWYSSENINELKPADITVLFILDITK